MRVILRQADITFSKDFIETNQERGIVLTRNSIFSKNAVCLNHGNANPIRLRQSVNKFYLLNHPEAIHYCSNKIDNYKLLSKFYPRTYLYPERVQRFPVIAKPIHGHHGYGIHICKNQRELDRVISHSPRDYIVQDLVDIKSELRFNVLDEDVYQVSKKIYLGDELKTPKGGYQFSYKSLGVDADITPKLWRFVRDIISDFHKSIKNSLASYGIDIMKDQNNNYYLTEINSAYGIGQFTLEKLIESINTKYQNGYLEVYRVR